MASFKWHKTRYPGVRYRMAKWPGKPSKEGKVFYGRFKKDGKSETVKLGEQWNGMNPAKAAELLADLKKGDVVQTKKFNGRTFDEGWTLYADSYDSQKDCRKRALSGFRSDNGRWKKYISDRFGHRRVDSLTKQEIDDFQADLKEADNGKGGKLSPQTRKHILSLLGRAAKAQGYADLKVDTPKVKNGQIDMPESQEQFDGFVAHLIKENSVVADMMLFAIYSGFRRGEIINLKWIDIDYDRNLIFIAEQKNDDQDFIPMLPKARVALMRQSNQSEYVFAGPKGNRRDADRATDTAGRIVDRFNEQDFGELDFGPLPENFRPFHSLRHWNATIWASSGKVDFYTLQKMLRHKDQKMTQRYAHLMPETFDRIRQISSEVF